MEREKTSLDTSLTLKPIKKISDGLSTQTVLAYILLTIFSFRKITGIYQITDLLINLRTPELIECSHLLRRAKDLNYEFDPHHTKPKRYLATYNDQVFETYLLQNFRDVESRVLRELGDENISKALFTDEEYADKAYGSSKVNTPRIEKSLLKMEEADRRYTNYRLCLRGESQGDRNEILKRYEHARKAVSNEIINEECKKWNELTADRNSKRLRHKIDWKGNLSNQANLLSLTTYPFTSYWKLHVASVKKVILMLQVKEVILVHCVLSHVASVKKLILVHTLRVKSW